MLIKLNHVSMNSNNILSFIGTCSFVSLFFGPPRTAQCQRREGIRKYLDDSGCKVLGQKDNAGDGVEGGDME